MACHKYVKSALSWLPCLQVTCQWAGAAHQRPRVWVRNIREKLLIQQNCGLFSPVKVISFDLLTFHQITFH